MPELRAFINQARENGLNNEQIKEALLAKGWDKNIIEVELHDISVPTPPPPTTASNQPKTPSSLKPAADRGPSTSPLSSALHHVLLWFFAAASSIAIGGVVATLFGEEISSRALAAMIAVTVITIVPYAVLFTSYLRQLKKYLDLVPGRVWSIITICIHSIGALVSAITAVITAIVGDSSSVLTGAILILILNLLIVATYYFATFGTARPGLRKNILKLYLPAVIILLGSLFVLSIFKLGPVRSDEALRHDLAATVHNIRDYTTDNSRLPEAPASDLIENSAITYRIKSSNTYELCANFSVDRSGDEDLSYYESGRGYTLYDNSVSEYSFSYSDNAGCFLVQAEHLRSRSSPYNDYENMDPSPLEFN